MKQGFRGGLGAIVVSILLAFGLWHVMFVLRPFNFWMMMTGSTVLLAAVSLWRGGIPCRMEELNSRNVMKGLAAAAVLYGIFWLGHAALAWAEEHTSLLPHRVEQLDAIYANRDMASSWLVALVLFFPIGFGEEVFWRGFVQRGFQGRWGKPSSFLLCVALYTAVHGSTGNPVLILAALMCGLFWSGLYWYSGSLVPVIISHMVWDPLIFVIAPIR
jgi:uncharacterized protein